jgi:putative spermidine/putrescine transport system substrate-binding protein
MESEDAMTFDLSLSRRRVLQSGGAGLALAAGGLWSRQADAAGRLVYSGFGGSYEQAIRKALFDPFAKANDITVMMTSDGSDVAKAIEMVKARRVEWDLVDAQGATLGQFTRADILETLDQSIDRSVIFNPSLATPYSVPWYQFSLNLFWNTATLPKGPQSWEQAWDAKAFPGKRGLSSLPWFSLEIALLADGVALDKLYPLDVDRAFKSLDRIKPHAVFLPTNALANAVSAQDVVCGVLNLARVKAIRSAGLKLDYTWNQAMIDIEQLVVLKGAPDRANAMKAIAYSLDVAPQLRILKSLGYTPTVKKALDAINPDDAKDLPGTAATRPTSFYLNSAWWGENGVTVGRRWQDWLAS